MTPSLANSFVLATLLVLACGYIIHDAPICRLWLSKSTGYVLYFRIITTGLVWLFTCQGIIYLLNLLDLLLLIKSLLHNYTLIVVFFFAVFFRVLAHLCVRAYGWKNPAWKYNLNKKILNPKGLDQFIYERINKERMIMVTLENRKVYAGWPLEAPNNEDNKWLRLIPQWSGCRNNKRTIKVETDYSTVIGTVPSDENCMLIPVEKIITVHPFDEDVFQQFNPGT